MSGKLYGIGVGPGDPELLTLKAVRLIRESEVIMVPGTDYRESVAYKIAVQAVPELANQAIIAVPMPMTKNKEQLEQAYHHGADVVQSYLDLGKQVGFLTLGDVTIYSTYLYIHRLVTASGYHTEIVNGIPSFCAAAAKLNMGLVEGNEELHILPASYQIEEGLSLSGTRVLMKAGKKLGVVKDTLVRMNADAVMVENCGMEGECIYHGAEKIPENAGYFSLTIVKNREKMDRKPLL